MLKSNSLREILKEIFGVDDKHLLSLCTDEFIPTTDPADKVATWIGYRVLNKTPYVRAYQNGVIYEKSIRVSFRMSFIGPQAEDLADSTLLWEDRKDVTTAFGRYDAQINYQDRQMFSYPVRNGGYNDELSWIVDMSAQTSYKVDTKQHPWIRPKDE